MTCGAGASLPFLRLVHVAPLWDPRRGPPGARGGLPGGMVYERVSGAWIEARGTPGQVLDFEAELELGGRRFRYSASARADDSGRARVRTPYSSERVGDLAPAAPFQVRFGARSATREVRESAVRSGSTIALP